MRYSAAVLGILLSLQVVCTESGVWNVKHTKSTICAVKGSTVTFDCTYRHPTYEFGQKLTVTKKFWFIHPPNRNSDPRDLSTDPHYAGRVRYDFSHQKCTLSISNVREKDTAQYNFRFTTDHPMGSYSGHSAVTLTVTDLEVTYEKSYLHCKDKCENTSGFNSYIWYESGQRLSNQRSSSHYPHNRYAHSYSCAVNGNEHHPSPSVCVTGHSCNWVKYRESQMCAPKGSSVEISCTYNSYGGQPTSELWFIHAPGRRQSSPVDLIYGRANVRKEREGSTLIISNVTDTDSAQYRFRFSFYSFRWGYDFPGTNLIVTDVKVVVARLDDDSNQANVTCQTSCSPPSLFSYVWFVNGQENLAETTYFFEGWFFSPGDRISCALQGYHQHRSPAVYALPAPTVKLSRGDIVEGAHVTLTCTTIPAQTVEYNWYKKGPNSETPILRNQQQLVFNPIQLSHCGEYYCTAGNELGTKTSGPTSIDVNYPPKNPSLTASIRGDIVEGNSMTLTCSSNAKPAATYTWYKGEHTRLSWQHQSHSFDTISHHDSGTYYCESANQFGRLNTSIDVNVLYSPTSVSVLVGPSGEVMVGSVVQMNCSSSANPVANYTWYKENDDEPQAWGPSFVITNTGSEHSGKYYCDAWNIVGHKNVTVHLLVMADKMTAGLVGSFTLLLLVVLAFVAFLLIRRKWSAKPPFGTGQTTTQPKIEARYTASQAQGPVPGQQEDVCYSSVAFFKKTEDPIYSNVTSAQLDTQEEGEEDDDGVEYSLIVCKGDGELAGPKWEDAVDQYALYSTVNKNPRA